MLKKQEILDYVSQNEGINTFDVIEKFTKKHQIRPESTKNHLYRLKKTGFLEERKKKLYLANPFSEIMKKIIESENSYELYKNLSFLNDQILFVLKDISPSAEKKMRELLEESLNKNYRFTSDNIIKNTRD